MGDRPFRSISLAITLLLLVLPAGCSQLAELQKSASLSKEPDAVDKGLAKANTRFAIKVFNELSLYNLGRNIVISPFGIASAIDMASNGAAEKTRETMRWTREVQHIRLADLNQANLNVLQALGEEEPNTEIHFATALLLNGEDAFTPSFLETIGRFYDAKGVVYTSTKLQEAIDAVNGWAAGKTRGTVSKLVDRMDTDDLLLLEQASRFAGAWKVSKSTASDRGFTLLSGNTKDVPMITQSGAFRYLRKEEFQVAAVPFGDSPYTYYIFLPYESLEELYSMLTPENWETWMDEFFEVEGTVEMPTFTIDYETRLKESLSSLGMGSAFDYEADFTHMVLTGGIWLGDLTHEARVSVAETLSERAASTRMEPTPVRELNSSPFKMLVDKPFFFAVVDERTDHILFMGSVFDPG
ncbi:MAG: serpin family protein [Candidatus Aquicultorales bacterium]